MSSIDASHESETVDNASMTGIAQKKQITKKAKHYPSTNRIFLKGIHLPPLLDHHVVQENEDGIETSTSTANRRRRLLFEEAIRQSFAPFVTISEVFVPDNMKKKSFCIVTLESVQDAQNLLDQYHQDTTNASDKLLFEEMRPGWEPSSKEKQEKHLLHLNSTAKSSESQQKDLLNKLSKMTRASATNLVIQCCKSHLERLIDYLQMFPDTATTRPEQKQKQQQQQQAAVVSGFHSIRSTSLIFLNCLQPSKLAHRLESLWYLHGNIQRIFVLEDDYDPTTTKMPIQLLRTEDVLSGSTDWMKIIRQKLLLLQSQEKTQCTTKIRLDVYHPKLQHALLSQLEEWFPEDASRRDRPIEFTPHKDAATHTLSVLELLPTNHNISTTPQRSKEVLSSTGLYYLIGLCSNTRNRECDATKNDDPSVTNIPQTSKKLEQHQSFDNCSRAYWKLQEAFERYSHHLLSIDKDSQGDDRMGMDVGASPGGWTQFLIEKCRCNIVWSIDPGALDPRVTAMTKDEMDDQGSKKHKGRPIVQHIPQTYQKGLPEIANLLKEQHPKQAKLDYYVSDMCVKTMSEQIDALLLAVDLGLVQSSTFVILTLKCTRGFSKATYENLVEKEVHRIRNSMDKLEVIHLFANRRSERTIIGFWK